VVEVDFVEVLGAEVAVGEAVDEVAVVVKEEKILTRSGFQ